MLLSTPFAGKSFHMSTPLRKKGWNILVEIIPKETRELNHGNKSFLRKVLTNTCCLSESLSRELALQKVRDFEDPVVRWTSTQWSTEPVPSGPVNQYPVVRWASTQWSAEPGPSGPLNQYPVVCWARNLCCRSRLSLRPSLLVFLCSQPYHLTLRKLQTCSCFGNQIVITFKFRENMYYIKKKKKIKESVPCVVHQMNRCCYNMVSSAIKLVVCS